MSGGLAPYAILAGGGLAAFVCGLLPGVPRRRLLFAVTLAATAGAAAAALWGAGSGPELAGFVDPGPWGRFFLAFSSGLTALVLLFASPYAGRRGFGGDELHGLLLWACLGMALLASATHWLSFFLGYELLSLCLYVLVALPRRGTVSAEAGLKYFIPGAVTSAFVAFGLALLYAATGSLDVAGSVEGGGGPWVLLGLACVLTGLAFKLSFVPFHLWTPDVYEGAPAPITAFLAAGSKVAVFAALLRLARFAGPEIRAAGAPALWVFAALTAVVGAVGALTQPRAKRLLAYSSIAHMGTLAAAVLAVHAGGAEAAVFYLAAYGAAEVGAFGLLGSLTPAAWDGDLDALEDLRGMGQRHPWRSACLAACLVSLAGLPPIGGFFAKLGVFVAVFRAGFPGLGVLLLAATVPAAYVYLRLAVSLYRPRDGKARAPAAPRAAPPELLAAGAAVLVLLWLGFWPSPWLEAARAALASLPPPG